MLLVLNIRFESGHIQATDAITTVTKISIVILVILHNVDVVHGSRRCTAIVIHGSGGGMQLLLLLLKIYTVIVAVVEHSRSRSIHGIVTVSIPSVH